MSKSTLKKILIPIIIATALPLLAVFGQKGMIWWNQQETNSIHEEAIVKLIKSDSIVIKGFENLITEVKEDRRSRDSLVLVLMRQSNKIDDLNTSVEKNTKTVGDMDLYLRYKDKLYRDVKTTYNINKKELITAYRYE